MTFSPNELVDAFVEESTEHLSTIENDLLAMEKAGETVDQALVNKVFRAAHSIKGGAGFIGLTNIKILSHKMETVLGLIRSSRLIPNPEIINPLLMASDALKNLISHINNSDNMDISRPESALNSLIPKPEPYQQTDVHVLQAPVVPEQSPLSAIFSNMNISEEERFQAIEEGKHIYMLTVDPARDIPFNNKSPEAIVEELKTYGTVLSTAVGNRPDDASSTTVMHIAFACVLNPDDLLLLLDLGPDSLFQMDDTHPPSFLPPDNNRQALQGHGKISATRDMPEHTASPLLTSAAETISEPAVFSGHSSEAPETRFKVRQETSLLPETSSSSIRVNIHVLNSLMNLASELVLSRNQLIKSISNHDRQHTEVSGKRIDHITSDLQRVIMLTRMQPVGNLFSRFPLLVRNISRELGKEINFEIEGSDVELDRTLLEAISDPLVHLVRNAADHGIETAAIRKKRGKGESGKIGVKAFNEAGQVVIEVADDGMGIDPLKIASEAVSRGFVTENQVRIMTERDKLNLIFMPGFSTASQVSDLSGRGVGMDVVKTNLDNLGGIIDIDSKPDKGTRIKIKLPLTLAIIPSQIVSVENERFAIPQINLEELIRIPAAKVQERVELVGSAEVVRLRGSLLPLVRVTDILNINRTYLDPISQQRVPSRRVSIADRRSKKAPLIADDFLLKPDGKDCSETSNGRREEAAYAAAVKRKKMDRRYHASSALNIVVVSTGQIRYGLIVDAFDDSEEIVVKPLGRHLKTCRGYAGATLMGDGKVALILDVNSLSEMAGMYSVDGTRRAAEVAREAKTAVHKGSDHLNLLIFRNAPDEQFALPMSQVLHVEKIRRKDIQVFGNTRTIQYHGGNILVFSMDNIARVQPLADRDSLLVIVFVTAGREFGLLATGPVDAVMTDARIDDSALKQPGIMGSVILNHKTTLLVDVLELVRHMHPEGLMVEDAPHLPASQIQWNAQGRPESMNIRSN